MENTGWNKERYRELNGYFRDKIRHQLATDPHLQSQVAEGKSLKLEEIVESLSLNDQVLWREFLHLDQLKMHQDLQNHLEGKGAPLHDGAGFYRSRKEEEDEEETLW
ncbi:hypothetical protein [Rufibacter latericius]|uniref:Uncharacterized protein n=1 Tax=Rufibacter latericius TaxID=2487040 RepID=A0A3M9MZL5_9BACT|nr:hypothetical protein [Rufibacter latericius]RNI30585.1 hypothetical protein EFB08_04870 [Rufibacter latericius]